MAAIDDLLEHTISHAIGLERYKARQVREMMKLLNATENDLSDLLIRRLDRILGAEGVDMSPQVMERLNDLVQEVAAIRAEGYTAMTELLSGELTKLAQYEAAWQVAVLQEVIPIELSLATPTAELLHAAAFERPFEGALMSEWSAGLPAADLKRIDRAIKVGVVEGKTSQEIVRDIVGTKGQRYTNGTLEVSRRGAEAVVRTATNHVATQAREEVYRANDDIIDGVRWTSTIDGRTTLICISRDQQVYGVRDGPRPPAHWRCRSTTIPVINGIKLIGDRPAITDTRNRKNREVDFRKEAKDKFGSRWKDMSEKDRRAAIGKQRDKWAKENIGTAPKDLSYQEWLKKQPAAFQDEVLGGKTRGQLFREGGLPVDKFIDRSGKTLSLDQLRVQEAATFKRLKL